MMWFGRRRLLRMGKIRFEAKVVWNIYPEPELVYVYTSRKQVQICIDDDICSATPVLPEFEVKVSEIFG